MRSEQITPLTVIICTSNPPPDAPLSFIELLPSFKHIIFLRNVERRMYLRASELRFVPVHLSQQFPTKWIFRRVIARDGRH